MAGARFTGPIKIRKSDGTSVTVIDENGNIDAPVTTTDLTTTGNTTLGNAVTDTLAINGATTITSTSASSLAVGRLGATTPAFSVDSATASQAAGLKVTGATTTGTVAVDCIGGAAVNLTIDAKGTGTIGIGSVSTGAVTITPATSILGALNFKRQVTDTGGVFATPIALTAAQSGRVILLDDAAGLDFTLPALSAAEIGTHYTFLLTVEPTSNSYRITAQTGDVLNGHVIIYDKDVAEGSTEALLQVFQANGSSHLVTTITGTDDTQGSLIGGWLEFTAISATGWFVRGSLVGDGALATIFS